MSAPSPAPRACAARVAAAAALLCVALASGCAGFSERWVEARFDEVSYASVYNIVLTTVDAEGYAVRNRQVNTGEISSAWVYGTSQRAVRGPSRRRVHARVEPDGERSWLVRLRVEEEVVRKGGLLATQVRESDNWEPYEDNFEDAEYLIARIAALLAEFRRQPAQSALHP